MQVKIQIGEEYRFWVPLTLQCSSSPCTSANQAGLRGLIVSKRLNIFGRHYKHLSDLGILTICESLQVFVDNIDFLKELE